MMILEDELLGNPFGALPIFRGELFNFRGVAGWNIHHLESMYFLLITGGFAACHVSLLEGKFDLDPLIPWGRMHPTFRK